MKKMKRFSALALALVLLVSLCACGGESAENVIGQARENVQGVTSMSYAMEMDMILSVQGESMRVLMNCEADYLAAPITQRIDTSVSMGSMGTMRSTTYTVPENDGYMSYVTTDDGTTWYKSDVTNVDELSEYNMQSSMELYLDSVTDFAEADGETIDGVETLCYTGTVSEEALEQVLEISGALNQLQSLGMVPEFLEISEMDLDAVQVRLWVDKETMLPVRYEMDMTAAIDGILRNAMGEEAAGLLTMERMTLLVELSNFDNVAAIELPAEAANAQELTDSTAA